MSREIALDSRISEGVAAVNDPRLLTRIYLQHCCWRSVLFIYLFFELICEWQLMNNPVVCRAPA